MRNKFKATVALLAITTFSAGAVFAQAPPPPRGGGGGGGMAPVLVESKAFASGGIVPLKYSFYGGSTVPDFKITNLPPTAQSVAVILHDIEVAMGGNPDDVLHWVAWNIPVVNGTTTIEEGKLPEGTVNGRGMRGNSYMGMGAPNGPRYHHYVFEFYALSSKLELPETAARAELLEAMKGKVVGKAAYVGRFRNDTNAPMPGMGGGAGGPPRGPGGPAAGPGGMGGPGGPGAGGPPRAPGAPGAPGAGAPPAAPGGY